MSEDEGGDKIALLKQRKGSKMTKNREQKLEKAIKLKMERWEEQHRHRNSSGFVF